MPDTMLAGLPRLVRVSEEIRVRGTGAVGIGVAAAGYAMFAWLLGQPVDGQKAIAAALIVGIPALLAAGLASRRRQARLHDIGLAPRMTVYETLADGRERRTRLASIVGTGVVVLMTFDHFTDGQGLMAGLVAGLFIGVGVVDLAETRMWNELERARAQGLYVIVRPHAMVASYATTEVYERPGGDRDTDREREPSPFDL
jgi:hypothetical protein